MARPSTLFIRKLLRVMPESLRNKALRSRINIPMEIPEGVTFEMAQNQNDLEQAFRILHDAYVQVGLMNPHPSGLRVSIYHALPTSIVLIAKKAGEVLGTVTIVRDSRLGLPSEKILNLQTFRRPGIQIAEISALAIQPQWRGKLFLPLLKYLYEIATRCLNIDVFAISVHRDWYFFYEALLFFKRIEDRVIDDYAFANFVPVVGEYLDLHEAYYQFARHYAHQPLSQNLFEYFCNRNLSQFSWPAERFKSIINPSMNIDTLDYFFNRKTDVFHHLSLPEFVALTNIYRDLGLETILPRRQEFENVIQLYNRKFLRVPSYFKGMAITKNHQIAPITVTEVSQGGLKALILDPHLQGDSIVKAKIQVGDFETAELQLAECWNASEMSGFRVSHANRSWQNLLEHYEERMLALASKAS